jgi:hypothetical protein
MSAAITLADALGATHVRSEIDALHAEIRDLNDALTQANVAKVQALADCETLRNTAHKAYHEATQATCEANLLRSKLAAFQAGAVVVAEYDRVRDQRDAEIAAHLATLANVDALTKQLATANDKRHKTLADERLSLLESIGRLLERATPESSERGVYDWLYAHLAEHGKRAHEAERYLAETHGTARREP